jgi:hypothetical protein
MMSRTCVTYVIPLVKNALIPHIKNTHGQQHWIKNVAYVGLQI